MKQGVMPNFVATDLTTYLNMVSACMLVESARRAESYGVLE